MGSAGLVLFPSRRGRPCVGAQCPCLPLGWELAQPLRCRHHLPFSLGKQGETDSSAGAGKKGGPGGGLRGDGWKKSHACRPLRTERKKKKKRGGAMKKKRKNLSKQTSGSHGYCQRSREVKRSREQHKGRGRTSARPFPTPAFRLPPLLPPLPPPNRPIPGGPPGVAGTGCRAPPAR